MKRRLVTLLMSLLVALSVCVSVSSFAAEETLSGAADDFYYAQLEAPAKEIYDALVAEKNLDALKRGSSVTVGGAIRMEIPADVTQQEYNQLIDNFNAKTTALSDYYPYMQRAMVAVDRDRPALFWVDGIHAEVVIRRNGEEMGSSFSYSIGHEYTATLEVTLPMAIDWATGGTRELATDIATVETRVSALAEAAQTASRSRYGQIVYLNEQLCIYNDYNDDALAAGGSTGYGAAYPWTPISALDQLTVADDAAAGALRPVCEGYARAFKLVCDALQIPCVLVSGMADGEAHMWCYVMLEDGAWYAMDVTWNDSTGVNRYLLAGADVMGVLHRPSTGADADGFTYPTLAAAAYEPTVLTLTASERELTGGGVVTLTPGGPLDHGTVTVTSPDCTPIANSDGTWSVELPNETAIYHFTATMTGEGQYNGLVAECTVSVTAHTHVFGDWTVRIAPTETGTGERYRVCACGFEESELLDPLTHDYSETRVVEPTCSERGYTEHRCIHCGDTYRDTYTDTVGHIYSNGICKTCGVSEDGTPADGSAAGPITALLNGLGCSAVTTSHALPLLLLSVAAIMTVGADRRRRR